MIWCSDGPRQIMPFLRSSGEAQAILAEDISQYFSRKILQAAAASFTMLEMNDLLIWPGRPGKESLRIPTQPLWPGGFFLPGPAAARRFVVENPEKIGGDGRLADSPHHHAHRS
jgi:hypothetical protein